MDALYNIISYNIENKILEANNHEINCSRQSELFIIIKNYIILKKKY